MAPQLLAPHFGPERAQLERSLETAEADHGAGADAAMSTVPAWGPSLPGPQMPTHLFDNNPPSFNKKNIYLHVQSANNCRKEQPCTGIQTDLQSDMEPFGEPTAENSRSPKAASYRIGSIRPENCLCVLVKEQLWVLGLWAK